MSHTTHKRELDSLLTLRFQSFKTLSLFPVKAYLHSTRNDIGKKE
jgi:hypothetical protein